MSLYSVLHPSIPPNSLSGGSGMEYTSGAPTDVPASNSGIKYDPSTGDIYIWNPDTQTWDFRFAGS